MTKKEIYEMYQKVKSARKVAKKAGCSKTTVLNIVNSFNTSEPVGKSSVLYDGEGNVKLKWVKQDKGVDAVQSLLDAFKSSVKPLPEIKNEGSPRESRGVDVIPIGDFHLGMYSWEEETGGDWDIEIARSLFLKAFEFLLDLATPSSEVVIVNLGDFFHLDNLKGLTPESGNVLDVDTRIQKVYRYGVEMLVTGIRECLKHYEKVTVVNAVGNHDEVLSYTLNTLLEYTFKDNPRVEIVPNVQKRVYLKFGKVFLGVLHGDKINKAKIPLVAAAEAPDKWGDTTYRYILKGHHHSEDLVEYPGCVVRTFRTLAPSDYYAYSHGFISKQDIRLLTLHEEYGLINEAIFPVKLLEDI